METDILWMVYTYYNPPATDYIHIGRDGTKAILIRIYTYYLCEHSMYQQLFGWKFDTLTIRYDWSLCKKKAREKDLILE